MLLLVGIVIGLAAGILLTAIVSGRFDKASEKRKSRKEWKQKCQAGKRTG